jgi:2-C-methyl-D-erythritol 4-phosphate cytidylyltransferase / 2-C-methyl-D-erythritol 2,4-cyclodiphosphate synthase
MNVWTVILAAGKGTRLSGEGGLRKQYLPWKGLPLFWHSVQAFSSIPSMRGLVLVFPEDECEHGLALAGELAAGQDPRIPWMAVPGGARRQDSVANALSALPASCTHVLVHDAARPFVSAPLVQRVVQAMLDGADAVIPAVAVTDTIKLVGEELVEATMPRARLAAAQTPQGFRVGLLRTVMSRAESEGWDVTDDASMVERFGHPVAVVKGEEGNVKITTARDLKLLNGPPELPVPCVGWGYDVHRYGAGRPMILGGVPIPGGPEVVAHSDGDVLLHALTDALLGCIGRGDIGELFPDTDPALAGISSAVLLAEVLDTARREGLTLCHVDLTVIAQVPRLAPYKEQIRRNVASLLGMDQCSVNIKATTEEGLGFTGECKGIKAVAAVTGTTARPRAAIDAGDGK